VRNPTILSHWSVVLSVPFDLTSRWYGSADGVKRAIRGDCENLPGSLWHRFGVDGQDEGALKSLCCIGGLQNVGTLVDLAKGICGTSYLFLLWPASTENDLKGGVGPTTPKLTDSAPV